MKLYMKIIHSIIVLFVSVASVHILFIAGAVVHTWFNNYLTLAYLVAFVACVIYLGMWWLGALDDYILADDRVPSDPPEYKGPWCVRWCECKDPSGSSRHMELNSLFDATVQWYKIHMRMNTHKDILCCGPVSTKDGQPYFALYPQTGEEGKLFWSRASEKAAEEIYNQG